MKYNINASGKGKLSADQKRSALWSKCAAKFGKVAKCAAGAKSLRTTDLGGGHCAMPPPFGDP